MQEPEVLEREDRAGAATMLQLMESQEYFASPEGACKPVVETGVMSKLMELKQKKYMEVKDSQRITAMLDSVCST